MSTRRPHLHSAGATRMRSAVVLPVLLLLLVACVVACPLCVRAVDTSSYTDAEQTNTLAFLQSFVTPGSTLADAWTGTDFCAWASVTCGYTTVTLDLQALRPTALLVLPELADTVHAASVLLDDIRAGGLGSSMSGTLPASWGRLTRLRFVQLAGNALTGPLPAAWSKLTGLRRLKLTSNALSGTLPAEWASMRRLSSLDVSVNQLTGPIPESWSSMSSLSSLYLQSNQLTGTIPAGLGARFFNEVNISKNHFCGCVSRLWNSSSTITLTADPPMRAWNCLRVSACPVDESSSAAERATLAFLQGFAVSMPSLQSVWADTRYCSWPGVVCTTHDTVALDFSDVALTTVGSLPELGNSVNGSLIPLTRVRISGKGAMVSGPLPASWSRLTQLTEVTLSGNALTGPLPAEWASMRRLSSLDVSVNQLSGAIPESWSSIPTLFYLYLQSNQLTGAIPSGLGPWFMKEANISSNQFCGCVSSRWNSSSTITLSADPAMRAVDCMSANACAVDESSSPAERATLAFLQGFAVSMPSLQSTWADTRYCAWPGVVCTMDKDVSLDFADVALTAVGSLPELGDSVNGSLVPVTQVQISGKGAMVSGPLPASWSRLTQLTEVTLAGNALTGPLPAEWSSLAALKSLDLDANQLSGSLPATWSGMPRLQSLNLGKNQLTGTLPESWGGMSSLRYLYLQSNHLTGAIPAGVGARFFYELDISSNQFCGCVSSLWNSSSTMTLSADPPMRAWNCMSANACAESQSSSPAERATLAFLQGFAVSMPSLQSTWADTRYCAWPGVLCAMNGDVTLDFAHVALTAAGSLPELRGDVNGSLVVVKKVRIRGKGAMVSGQLPASWSRLTQLSQVNLTGNALTGPLPAAWSSFTNVRMLNVGNNALSGSLPAEWSTLDWLGVLDMSRNALSGTLPAEWGSMRVFGRLDLSVNTVHGTLPAEWSSLNRLGRLNLGGNGLSGTLPADWGNMHLLEKLYLNNNQLMGTIPAGMGTLPLSAVDISSNQFVGCVPRQWMESCNVTLRADPPMTTGVCGAGTSCGVAGGHAASSSAPATETPAECQVSMCRRCEAGAVHVCAECEPGHNLTHAKTCRRGSSGGAAAASAGAAVAAVTCAVVALSLAMSL